MEKSKSMQFSLYILLIAGGLAVYEGVQTYQNARPEYSLKVDNDLIRSDNDGCSFELEHLPGSNQDTQLQIHVHKKNGEKEVVSPEKTLKASIKHIFQYGKQQIERVIIESSEKLELKGKGRLLLSLDKSKPAILGITNMVRLFISIMRNMVIICLLTNSLDLWMPLLHFIECFLMIGLWTHDVHYISEMYEGIFKSKADFFNLLRFMFVKEPEASKITILNDFGFSNKFVGNISGQFSVLVLLLLASFAIKISNIFVKSERLREVNSALRPVWNGYIFWMTPKMMTMAGLHIRGMSEKPNAVAVLNALVAGASIFGTIFFIGSMINQVRKINMKIQYIDESRMNIGMANRINYMRDFEFDCLQFSMLYYPVMNQIRCTFAFLCVGFASDFHYVQFGGVLAAQVFYMMIQISCSPFYQTRHKILYSLLDFVFAIYILFSIGLGLIYSVRHMELTIKIQIFLLSLLLTMIVAQTVSILIDAATTVRKFIKNYKKRDEEQLDEDEASVEEKKSEKDSKEFHSLARKKTNVKSKNKNKKSKSNQVSEAGKGKGKDRKEKHGDKENKLNDKPLKPADFSDEDEKENQNIFEEKRVKVKKVKKGKVI